MITRASCDHVDGGDAVSGPGCVNSSSVPGTSWVPWWLPWPCCLHLIIWLCFSVLNTQALNIGDLWSTKTSIPVICQGHNKDLWSQRSKYRSYEALRGCDLGARDHLQVCCRVKTVKLWGSAMWCKMVQDKCKTVWGISAKSQFWGKLV